MDVLRDVREGTRLLFLYEVTANRHSRLRTIAERLGMTVQRASQYASDLEREGLLTMGDGEYRATKRGVESLQGRVRELRSFIEQAGRATAFVETTSALAGTPIRRGDRVGLFMERGLLVAHAGKPSSSTGIAVQDAAKGEDVAVRSLEGIVSLRPLRIVIARLPPAQRGGSHAISIPVARKLLRRCRGFVVGALDVTGLVAARKLGLRPRIEFGVIPAAIEAAQRGVDVLLLVPEDRVAEAVHALEVANAGLEDKIPYENVGIG